MSKRVLCCILLFSASLMVGCLGDGRIDVAGSVSVDGTPVEHGSIMFIPIEETPGPTAGALIRGGTYEIVPGKGPMAGKFRVEILAVKETGKASIDIVTGEKGAGRAQFLPPRFNKESDVTVEISGDRDAYDFDLKLEK